MGPTTTSTTVPTSFDPVDIDGVIEMLEELRASIAGRPHLTLIQGGAA